MSKNFKVFRRSYRTEYYDKRIAAGNAPIAVGYASSYEGAKRALATHLVAFEEYQLGRIINRETGHVLAYLPKPKHSLFKEPTDE